MANNTHMDQILTQARALIVADEPIGGGNLNLKVCQVSDISQLYIWDDISNYLPAVFLYPSRSFAVEPMDLYVYAWDIVYEFVALLVEEYAVTDNPTTLKVAHTGYLADIFLTATNRFTDLATVQMLWSYATGVEYQPNEEVEITNNFEGYFMASAVTVQVATSTQRT